MFREKLKYAFYTIGHPADGFYEIRHRGQGSVPLAILFVFLFGLCFSANRHSVRNIVDLSTLTSAISKSPILNVS